MTSCRTDLALEEAQNQKDNLPPGVSVTAQPLEKSTFTVVEITTPQAARQLKKPQGVYLTLEQKPIWKDSADSPRDMEAAAAGLRSLLPQEGLVLVVGLGNREITPDALGPAAAGQVVATRHISGEVAEATGLTGLRPVACTVPNVLGKTGVEAAEAVKALVHCLNPAAVIAIDAFAAGEISRLGTTIQIANTGISPGSGVLNARKELCAATLGVPVVSRGRPTVVDLGSLSSQKGAAGMMITPREIDLLISRGARALSLMINRALQPTLSLEDLAFLSA